MLKIFALKNFKKSPNLVTLNVVTHSVLLTVVGAVGSLQSGPVKVIGVDNEKDSSYILTMTPFTFFALLLLKPQYMHSA